MAARIELVPYGPTMRSTLSTVMSFSYRLRVISGFDWSSSNSHCTGRPSSPLSSLMISTNDSPAILCSIAVCASGPVRDSVPPMRIGLPEGAARALLGAMPSMRPPAMPPRIWRRCGSVAT